MPVWLRLPPARASSSGPPGSASPASPMSARSRSEIPGTGTEYQAKPKSWGEATAKQLPSPRIAMVDRFDIAGKGT